MERGCTWDTNLRRTLFFECGIECVDTHRVYEQQFCVMLWIYAQSWEREEARGSDWPWYGDSSVVQSVRLRMVDSCTGKYLNSPLEFGNSLRSTVRNPPNAVCPMKKKMRPHCS